MYLNVHVTPGAKREKVQELASGALVISVKEPAERNQANNRVRELVAQHYKLPVGKVRLVAGFRSPRKIVSVPD